MCYTFTVRNDRKGEVYMFIRHCQKLDFPTESHSPLEEAYLSLTLEDDVRELFETALNSMLNINEILFNEVTEKIVGITRISPYTLNALLCVAALEPLEAAYQSAKASDKLEVFLKNLAPQLLLCKEKHGVWGLENGFWQWMFHELCCVTLGRLEYEPFHHFCERQYGEIKKGDPVILIHIPRGNSLDMDEVTDSLKLAYEYFKDRFDNETVPFMTHSWLIYPPFLKNVFKKGGNLQKFAELFDIIAENTAGYANFPNVFGCQYPVSDFSGVPQKTSMQRSMLEFIKQGNLMGEGYGIFFYGKSGMTKIG